MLRTLISSIKRYFIEFLVKRYGDTYLASSLGNLVVLKRMKKRPDDSYANEFTILKNLIYTNGIEGSIVDIGASDGYTYSSTLGFFLKEREGLCIESDSKKFSRLSFLYSRLNRVSLVKLKVTPFNITSLLKAFEFSNNISLLNLDIDSFDGPVLERILAGGFKPKVLSIEINEKIPSGIYFMVKFEENHIWRGDHFYGMSIDAAFDIASKYGYSIYTLEYNNLILISDEIVGVQTQIKSISEFYKDGYLDRSDRKSLFPWNSNVEHWINLSVNDAISEIRKFFCDYEDKFIIRETNS